MCMKATSILATLALATATAIAAPQSPTIKGDYLEVRSCDVYTGPCFANAEMGLAGKEGILVWSIREGAWRGVALDGLTVIAVVSTDATLGDLGTQPRAGRAVLIVDAKADARQQQALAGLARSQAGRLIAEVVEVKTAPIEARLGGCDRSGCAAVKAGALVEIATRCFGSKDHVCGNEETYYPPLTAVQHAAPAFTELAAYRGDGLGLTWEGTGQRSAFIGTFSL
jgi:hypothetical protein